MCTVSYISTSTGFILTSNRDEKVSRKTASLPITDNDLIYPKDEEKEGTWIVMKQNGNVVCLLNGAFHKHTLSNAYKKSRGIVVLDIIKKESIYNEVFNMVLDEIEPFTLIIIEQNKLIEFRWDGSQKHYKILNNKLHYIWRSSTLYNADIREQSEELFTTWTNSSQQISTNDILDFHKNTTLDTIENSFIVNRKGELKTVSITNIEKKHSTLTMYYEDLIHKQTAVKQFIHIEAQQ